MKAQEIQNSEHMLSPTHSSSLLNTPIETFHTTRKSSPSLQSSPGQKTSVKGDKSADTGEIHVKDISFEPAVVDLDQLEKQIQQDLRFASELQIIGRIIQRYFFLFFNGNIFCDPTLEPSVFMEKYG